MAEPDDMIIPLLREMRAETASQLNAMRAESTRRHELYVARIDKMEATLETFRHALSADSLLSKLVTGDCEERIESVEGLEKRVALLERKMRELESFK